MLPGLAVDVGSILSMPSVLLSMLPSIAIDVLELDAVEDDRAL